MAGNKPIILLLLLAFLFLMTAPLVLIFAYQGFSAAATAGLFIIPVLMVFLAVMIVAVKKRRLAIPSAAAARPAAKREQVRYPWESMFGSKEDEYVERRKPLSKPSAAGFRQRVSVAVVIAVVVLALVVVLQQKGADVQDANKTLGEKPAIVEVKPQQNFTPVKISAVAKKVVDSAKGFVGKIKGKFVGSFSKVKSAVAKAPVAVWQGIAVAVVSFLLTVTVFYSAKSGQLAEVSGWSGGWLGWLLGSLLYARRNKLKVLLWFIAAAVASAVVAVVVFRKWIIAKLPSVSGLVGVAVNALLAVKDFVSVYRTYIIIGVFALLAIIGVLVALERRGKG